MTQQPNKLSQFWQELKRRKVLRVITVYAAVAFVILQLVEILAPSLRLPEWTMNFILVILIVGFIIAVILSWIYDVHPEGGIVKTESAKKIKAEDIPVSSNSWKIASYISFVVIVGLIVLNIIPRTNKAKRSEILDKSIAVLPFINDSADEENAYFINGTMEAILDNLCKIEDLRVVGRTSVEQYRNALKPIPVIAEEMNVSYILEGSGQKDGNKVRLTLQLIDGINDKHLWSSPYIREIEVGQIFDLQSEIAKLVASEIEAIVTPEEIQRIESVPTHSLTAYDFVLRGEEEMNNFNFERAEELFNKALIYDSTYALAYAMLGAIYGIKSFTDHNRDTVLKFIDKALYYDDELPGAYILKGNYFQYSGRMDQAILAYEKAFKLKPNDYWTNFYIGYYYAETDYIKCIKAWQRAASLSSGSDRSQSLKNLGTAYSNAGFEDKALEYYSQVVSLDGDSSFYYRQKAFYEYGNSDIDQAIKYFRKAHVVDSTSNESIYDLLNLGWSLYTLGKYQESLNCGKSALEFAQKKKLETIIFQDYYHRLALVYLKNGFSEEAEHYFNRAEESLPKSREMTHSLFAYYELAAFNAFKGEKEQALEYLRILNQRKLIPYWKFRSIKLDKLFDSIRDEPEFQQIVRDVEAKYLAEHERVRKWLEENDML